MLCIRTEIKIKRALFTLLFHMRFYISLQVSKTEFRGLTFFLIMCVCTYRRVHSLIFQYGKILFSQNFKCTTKVSTLGYLFVVVL